MTPSGLGVLAFATLQPPALADSGAAAPGAKPKSAGDPAEADAMALDLWSEALAALIGDASADATLSQDAKRTPATLLLRANAPCVSTPLCADPGTAEQDSVEDIPATDDAASTVLVAGIPVPPPATTEPVALTGSWFGQDTAIEDASVAPAILPPAADTAKADAAVTTTLRSAPPANGSGTVPGELLQSGSTGESLTAAPTASPWERTGNATADAVRRPSWTEALPSRDSIAVRNAPADSEDADTETDAPFAPAAAEEPEVSAPVWDTVRQAIANALRATAPAPDAETPSNDAASETDLPAVRSGTMTHLERPAFQTLPIAADQTAPPASDAPATPESQAGGELRPVEFAPWSVAPRDFQADTEPKTVTTEIGSGAGSEQFAMTAAIATDSPVNSDLRRSPLTTPDASTSVSPSSVPQRASTEAGATVSAAPVAFAARIVRRAGAGESSSASLATASMGTGDAREGQPALSGTEAAAAPLVKSTLPKYQRSGTTAPRAEAAPVQEAAATTKQAGQASTGFDVNQEKAELQPTAAKASRPSEEAETTNVKRHQDPSGHAAAPALRPSAIAASTPAAPSPDAAGATPLSKTPRQPEANVSSPARSSVPEPAGNAPVTPPSGEVRVRLDPGTSEPGVEVRVRDNAGELRVSVRTPDGGLAQTLREGLPELVERLDQRGYRTEVWRPASADTPGASARNEIRTVETEAGGNGSFQQPDGSQSQDGDGRDADSQPAPDEWEAIWNASRGKTERRVPAWQAL